METAKNLYDWLMQNANGVSETIILWWLVFADTVLGSLWRSNWQIRKLSKGAISGILTNFSLASLPMLIFISGAIVTHIPVDINHESSMANWVLFDVSSTILSLFIGYWLAKSIIANWKLSGHDLPVFVDKWVEDEAKDKLERNDVNVDDTPIQNND